MFNQFIVGQYKSALSRQVAEAVRIQMRCNVLNSVGMFNRCKLTRLVIDHEWDKKVWEDSWERRNLTEKVSQALGEDGAVLIEDEAAVARKAPKRPRKEKETVSVKKRKIENESGFIWGEQRRTQDKSKEEFLLSEDNVVIKKMVQKLLLPLTGAKLMARCVALEMVSRSVDIFSSRQEEKEIRIAEELLAEDDDWGYIKDP